jgi:succinylglutamic semialdehyde dehydrogenase
MSANSEEAEELVSISPADASDHLGRFAVADRGAVGEAIARAREAFPAWRDLSLEARARYLKRYAAHVEERRGELARLIAREVGKALWEARAEAALIPAKVAVTLGEGMRFAEPLEAGPNARCTFHPRGVLAVLGPFNFPAHLPNGHLVPALAAGNTVVFKPSDSAPAVGAWLAGAFRAAGLPQGVLEVVQGGAPTGSALAAHADVDGVLFTGSYGVGRQLREATFDQPWKILALEMGGKNAMVVLSDADLELAAAEAAISMCATTGQRCTSLSRIFVESDVLEAFQQKFVPLLERLTIGAPLAEGTFMGPLVSKRAHERVEHYRSLATSAGGDWVIDRDPELGPPYTGPGLARFASAAQDHAFVREEIFGPLASLHAVSDLDEAIAAVNDSDFGLAASVMTRDRTRYERAAGRIRTGILNWNRGTVGASGRLPFGGLGRSGNDRPAGILSTVYCTVPQARLEHEGGLDPESLPPGLPQP